MKPNLFPMPDPSRPPETAILADGLYPASEPAYTLLSQARRVVCCDGAADAFIARGGIPEAIVGDCDSLGNTVRVQFADRLHIVSEQDTNDLTKSVNYCLKRGWNDLTLFGATGLREDHTLGNISLLAGYAQQAKVRMITDWGVFDTGVGDLRFESFPGQQVSIFSLVPGTPVSAFGLRYVLPSEGLRSWWQGTLNESLGNEFSIHSDTPVIVFRTFA